MDFLSISVELRFVANSIFLEVPETKDSTPSDGFLGIPDVNEYLIRARPYEINKTAPVEYIGISCVYNFYPRDTYL